ncbi:MAG: lysophospholipase [Hyphomicrobiales bacterium]
MAEHGSGTFTLSGGAEIFEQWWRPDGSVRAVLAICHGYAEHSGRYKHVALALNAHGYAVEALDLRGHGRSSGERVTVDNYDEYLDDLGGFLARVRERNAGRPLFLLGHSMGGGIVVSYVIARRPALDGVLLSGAAMLGERPQPKPEDTERPRGPLPASAISRDPAVVAAYENDPQVYRGAPSPRSLAASHPAYERVQARMHESSSRCSSCTAPPTSSCRTRAASGSWSAPPRRTRRSGCTKGSTTKS